MAKKRATKKQLAARKKFVAAVRAGKFRKKRKAAKKKPAKKRAAKKRASAKRDEKLIKTVLSAHGERLKHGYEIVIRKRKAR